MFESAELGHKVDKETYEREVPILREALLDAQYDLISRSNPRNSATRSTRKPMNGKCRSCGKPCSTRNTT